MAQFVQPDDVRPSGRWPPGGGPIIEPPIALAAQEVYLDRP